MFKYFIFALAFAAAAGSEIITLKKTATAGRDASAPKGIVEGVKDCGSTGRIVSVSVTDCTIAPCSLVPGNVYDFDLRFIASQDSSTLSLKLTLILGGTDHLVFDSPIPGEIAGGIEYDIAFSLPVPREQWEYFVVKFEIVDTATDRTEICASVDANVVDAKVTEKVYFDITTGGNFTGRVVIGLFGEVVPRTVLNFATICTEGIEGKSYTGSIFHRVINQFMIQGGDIVNGDGTGSISIYGPVFDDENFDIKHSSAGYVSMANAGPNSNGCQFFITTVRTQWLDGFYVVFGKVLEGLKVVHQVERSPTDSSDRPIQRIEISHCGSLPV